MGIGGLREHSLSHCDKVKAGATPAKYKKTASAHRRVLGGRFFVCHVFFFSVIQNL